MREVGFWDGLAGYRYGYMGYRHLYDIHISDTVYYIFLLDTVYYIFL